MGANSRKVKPGDVFMAIQPQALRGVGLSLAVGDFVTIAEAVKGYEVINDGRAIWAIDEKGRGVHVSPAGDTASFRPVPAGIAAEVVALSAAIRKRQELMSQSILDLDLAAMREYAKVGG